MNIQEAAAASGLTPDTIRFYEKQGVLPRPPRQVNGYRHYTEEHILILRLAKGLRHLAVSLDELKPVIEVAHSGTCRELRGDLTARLQQTLLQTEQRLADLLHVRDHLRLILDGLQSMRPSDETVPGMKPCECVRLVSEATE